MFLIRKGYLQSEIDGKTWVSYMMDNRDKTHKAIIVKGDIEYAFFVNIDRYKTDDKHKYIIVLDDITIIEKFAHTDYLTQICNRFKLDNILNSLFYNIFRYRSF